MGRGRETGKGDEIGKRWSGDGREWGKELEGE